MIRFDISGDQGASPDLAYGIDGMQANFDAASTGTSLNAITTRSTKTTPLLGAFSSVPTGSATTRSTPTAPIMPTSVTLPLKGTNTPSMRDLMSGASITKSCIKTTRTCSDGTVQVRDPKLGCAYPPCPTTPTPPPVNPNQSYIDKFKDAFGVLPTDAQLHNFITLWNGLGRQPSGEEFNCYVSTGNPVCTTSPSTDPSTGGGGGGGAAPTEDPKAGEVPTVEAKKTPWLLYGGIAAGAIGIIGLIMKK